jgi:hypothetical protein
VLSLTRVRRLVPSPIRRAAVHAIARRRAADVDRRLAALARSTRPIVVGPWLGEVGFELLYWVPFVRWAAARYELPPERLMAVSRGGAAAWYVPAAARSLEVLTLMPADVFRGKNHRRTAQLGEQKQIAIGALDEEILAAARQAAGGDVDVLHPSLMYHLFAPYWWGHLPLSWVRRHTVHAPLQPPAIDIDLPERYTAVKFYFNDCFHASPANRAWVERTVASLSAEGPVISLSTGVSVDDHQPCEPDVAAMHGIRHLLTAPTNLLVQSAIVARARRFVGTYGGFAYLAPFYGVPTVSYYTHPDAFSRKHLDLALDVLARPGRPDLLQLAPVPACSAA